MRRILMIQKGKLTEKGNVNVSQDEIESVINSFVGEIEQTPPIVFGNKD